MQPMQGVAALLMDQHLVICHQKSLQKHLIFRIAVSFTSIQQLFESFQAAKDLENSNDSKWCNRKRKRALRNPLYLQILLHGYQMPTRIRMIVDWLLLALEAVACQAFHRWDLELQSCNSTDLCEPAILSRQMSQTNGSTLAGLVVFKRMLNVNYSNCSQKKTLSFKCPCLTSWRSMWLLHLQHRSPIVVWVDVSCMGMRGARHKSERSHNIFTINMIWRDIHPWHFCC